jgi:hypothetical protein
MVTTIGYSKMLGNFSFNYSNPGRWQQDTKPIDPKDDGPPECNSFRTYAFDNEAPRGGSRLYATSRGAVSQLPSRQGDPAMLGDEVKEGDM